MGLTSLAVAQEPSPLTVSPEGCRATRSGNIVTIDLGPLASESVTIPRLTSSLRQIVWKGVENEGAAPTLTPEPESWIIRWKVRESNAIELTFDDAPRLLSESSPTQANGDGSIFLAASRAITAGEKIRFEPQTFKNTVGYWTGKQDSATWTFLVNEPGSYNVAILQGCGKGQGGSEAKLEVFHGAEPASLIKFEVLETGHFQNFVWRHLGEIELTKAGVWQLRLSPIAIKAAALMDVRAVHLVRLPPRR